MSGLWGFSDSVLLWGFRTVFYSGVLGQYFTLGFQDSILLWGFRTVFYSGVLVQYFTLRFQDSLLLWGFSTVFHSGVLGQYFTLGFQDNILLWGFRTALIFTNSINHNFFVIQRNGKRNINNNNNVAILIHKGTLKSSDLINKGTINSFV